MRNVRSSELLTMTFQRLNSWPSKPSKPSKVPVGTEPPQLVALQREPPAPVASPWPWNGAKKKMSKRTSPAPYSRKLTCLDANKTKQLLLVVLLFGCFGGTWSCQLLPCWEETRPDRPGRPAVCSRKIETAHLKTGDLDGSSRESI